MSQGNLYFVRRREDKEAAGIFFSGSVADLWWLVDQIGDPADFEYRSAKCSGGIIFDNGTNAKFGVGFGFGIGANAEDWEGQEIMRGADFDDYLCDQAADEKGWRRLPYADEPGGGVHELVRKHGPKRAA